MKKTANIILFFGLCIAQPANAQVLDIIKIVTERVIKAMDLKVQRMQTEVMNLQIAQKQAENRLSKSSLEEIGSISQQQRDLYKNYYASLVQVKQTVSQSALVIKILQQQKALVVLYNVALSASNKDTHLSSAEKSSFTKACASLIDEGASAINNLEQTLRNNQIKATDAERLKLITTTANQIEGLLYKLQTIYTRQQQVSLARSKSESEAQTIKSLYGLQ